MRIEAWLRRLLYASLAVLFLTGVAWWGLTEESPIRAYLIALHGIVAMLTLLALGAIAVLHVRESWRRRRNRQSGIVVCSALAALIVTAFGLYYLGSEELRGLASLTHLAIGVALPLLLIVHMLLGVRSRPGLDDDASEEDW